MAATLAHCQQLVDKLRVLSASDEAAKIDQVRLPLALPRQIDVFEFHQFMMSRPGKLSLSSRLP
jgi:hypothetical protein